MRGQLNKDRKNNMTYIINATAPTAYQLNSLSEFDMGYKANRNGSFSASEEFDTEEEAKEYLRKRAEKFNDEHSESEEKLAEMYADIDCGCLTLDAVTAHIEEKNEEE